MRVAVLGAGAAGLCSVRHLVESAAVHSVVVYEQTTQVGGTWVYSQGTGSDANGLPIHSSMYRDMKTNLPVEAMQFPDFPFRPPPHESASFVSHTSVRQYLNDYADHFGLRDHIQFGRHVTRVCREGDQWAVHSTDARTRQPCAPDSVDAVFVCNGHYFEPRQLDVSPYEPKRLIHSHNYRERHEFAGQVAACLGAGPSGVDIAIELSAVCPKVYLCHNRERLRAKLPPNVIQAYGFDSFTKDYIELTDGQRISPDLIVNCTGYHYRFPFLDGTGVRLSVQDDRVSPLYQHLIHIDHPSLVFVGLCSRICPFPNFDVQIRFAVAMLEGKFHVSRSEMTDWERQDFDRRIQQLGMKPSHAHFMGAAQWHYCRQLANIAGFPNPIEPYVERLYNSVHETRTEDLVDYKKMKFKVTSAVEFERET